HRPRHQAEHADGRQPHHDARHRDHHVVHTLPECPLRLGQRRRQARDEEPVQDRERDERQHVGRRRCREHVARHHAQQDAPQVGRTPVPVPDESLDVLDQPDPIPRRLAVDDARRRQVDEQQPGQHRQEARYQVVAERPGAEPPDVAARARDGVDDGRDNQRHDDHLEGAAEERAGEVEDGVRTDAAPGRRGRDDETDRHGSGQRRQDPPVQRDAAHGPALYQMPCYARRSVQASARPSPLTVVSGFASHLIAGVLPVFSAAAITSPGPMRGTALLYAAGATLILLACLSPRVRTTLRRETTALLVPAHRRLFAAGLAGFLFAGVWYYFGLSTSARVAEYIFLTRLDWVVQAVFAIVWLGEPWTARGAVGAGLALGGGLLLAWIGAFGPSGLAAAVLYIAASLAGYSFFKPLSAARRSPGATTLTVWRHLVNTAGFSALAVLVPAEGSGMTTAGLAA